MSTITNFLNFDNTVNFSKTGKLEDAKKEAYLLRKHINHAINSSFIPGKASSPYCGSTLRQNSKSQVEELQKLQTEVSYMEEKIKELEVSKKMKLVKIEDLRKIITRIADDECFDRCLFKPKMSRGFMPRERCDKGGVAKANGSLSRRSNADESPCFDQSSIESTSNDSGTGDVGQGEEGAGEGEGANDGISGKPGYCPTNCRSQGYRLHSQDLLRRSLLFWTEHLSAPIQKHLKN